MGFVKTRWHSKKLLDVSKLNKLGWFASTEINNGIKSTINNYSDNLNKNKLRSKLNFLNINLIKINY